MDIRTCEHPDCTQPASSRVGGMYEGHWNGHTVICCLAHVNYMLARPMFTGTPSLAVGVLDRR